MKTYLNPRKSILKTVILGMLLFLFSVQAYGQLVWLHTSSGNRDWWDETNWEPLGGDPARAPNNPESERIIITWRQSIQTINFNSDQTLLGGMDWRLSTSNSGTLTMNLGGYRLTMDGGANGRLLFEPRGGSNANANENSAIISNGTLRIGEDSATALIIGGGTADSGAGAVDKKIWMVFAEGSTLDTYNTSSIEVSSSNINRIRNMGLDLSAAKLVSGDDEDTLRVSGSIRVGENLHVTPASNSTRHKFGSLRLGVLSTLDIGEDLIVGRNVRTNSVTTTDARGSLAFSTSDDQGTLVMTVGRDLLIGVGSGATGEILDAPEDLRLTIASETNRGTLQVGYKSLNNTGDSIGSFISTGGTLEAWLSSLSIGHSSSTNTGVVTGVFDFQSSVLSTLDIAGAAVVGKGLTAKGDLRLHAGNARSQTLEVGVTTGTEERSLLRLDGTLWAVEESLHVGGNGDIEILLYGQSTGLDLEFSDIDSLVLDEGAKITLFFENAPSSDLVWGLRIVGDYVNELQSMIVGGQLVAAGTYGDYAVLFSDGSYTWYGMQLIPEPSIVTALIAGAVLVCFIGRRRLRDKA